MKRSTWIAFAVLCYAVLLFGSGPASAANCACYYDSDCGEGNYCNWDASCTRHCELQGTWKPEWGQPPVSKADCDKWTGPCHDNQPRPPQGDDGDGENCEPPKATTPDGGTINFKVRDGMCEKRPAVIPVDPVLNQVQQSTFELVAQAASGGGYIRLRGNPYVRMVMHNLGVLALGQYDFSLRGNGRAPRMGDIRAKACGAETLQTLGEALEAEILSAHRRSVEPARAPRGSRTEALRILKSMPAACQEWIQTRPHNCQYPHPAEHHHPFDYVDGLHCIASQIHSMALSLNLE